jgi:hypothetical protein
MKKSGKKELQKEVKLLEIFFFQKTSSMSYFNEDYYDYDED